MQKTVLEVINLNFNLCLISSKLRVRAFVWKTGAPQPGGPPPRATTARPPRSSPPGMRASKIIHILQKVQQHATALCMVEATGSLPSTKGVANVYYVAFYFSFFVVVQL